MNGCINSDPSEEFNEPDCNQISMFWDGLKAEFDELDIMLGFTDPVKAGNLIKE